MCTMPQKLFRKPHDNMRSQSTKQTSTVSTGEENKVRDKLPPFPDEESYEFLIGDSVDGCGY